MGGVVSGIGQVFGIGRDEPRDLFGGVSEIRQGDKSTFDILDVGARGEDLQQRKEQENEFLELILARARGEEPSLAEQQLKVAAEDEIARQQGALASTRGLGGALAARQAARLGAEARQTASRDAATARIAEQQAAQQLGLSGLQSARAADIRTALANAELKQAFQENKLRGDIARAQISGQLSGAQGQLDRQAEESKFGARGNLISGIGGGIATGVSGGGFGKALSGLFG